MGDAEPILRIYACAEKDCDFESRPGRKYELEEHQKKTGHKKARTINR